jgi:predicted TIM-barrel fold metal-dependent hydrolase
VIDVHRHYLAPPLRQALAGRSEVPRLTQNERGTTIEYGPGSGHLLLPPMTDLDLQREAMGRAGIEHAVLSLNVPGVDWFAPEDGVSLARDVNDDLAARCRDDPALSAVAVLPMQAPDQVPAELERAVGLGLRGAIVYSNVAGRSLAEPEFWPLFEAATALDVPIMLHPTYPLSSPMMDAYALIPTLGFLVDSTTAVLLLVFGGLFERHPEVKLYVCHAGALLPQLAGRIDYEASRLPGGMGALTAPPSEQLARIHTDAVCAWTPALRSALSLVGPTRMMFGSDYPFWAAERTVEAVEAADLPADVRADILSGNAARLFGIPSSSHPVADAGPQEGR